MHRQESVTRHLRRRPGHAYRIALLCFFLALGLARSAAPATADRSADRAPTAPPPASSIDAAELEGFLDSMLHAQLEQHHLAGATVAVVKDGRLLLAKGYGYADRAQGKPVVADQTLFRVGSVSKLFTATAVMQLVEQGKLDLHADVNTYLKDFRIPATYPQPITLAHLLTHSAGFEDRKFALLAQSADDLQPLGPYLADNLPARVRPPGELAAYSNHSLTLAGYIVEQVSGLPFADYVGAHILQPLGMRRSTFSQPVPQDLALDLALGYRDAGNMYHAEPVEYVQVAPAGALCATITDMARFMIAHLQDGQYEQARILQAATVQDMHRQHFSHTPGLTGWTYGFQEMQRNHQRILWHGGDAGEFHGVLVLLPQQNTGLVVFYNSANANPALYMQVVHAFVDRYYPASAAPTPLPADFQSRAQRFTGTYRGLRAGSTHFLALESLLATASVSATSDGYLVTTGAGFDATPQRWVEVEPLVFRHVDGQDTLTFRADSQDHITHMFVGNFPMSAFAKLAWYETLPVQGGLVAVYGLLFLSVLLVWPLGMLLARRRRSAGSASPVAPRRASWLLLVVSALNVLFVIGYSIWWLAFYPKPYEVPLVIGALLVLPLLATALTLGLLVFTVLAWRNRYWSVAARLHYSLVTVAALGFTEWLSYWNLLGFHL